MRLGCRVSREVPVLCSSQLSGAGGTPGGAGSERREQASREPLTEADGARRPFVCGRGAGALRPVAPALARPSSRRHPDSPARARARPPPALPPPRLRPQPRPCPGPRAPTCCGGDSWSPGHRTGGPSSYDPDQEAASPEQPGFGTSCVDVRSRGSLAFPPGACSSELLSLLQASEVPSKPGP